MITPALNKSTYVLYGLSARISGATYPGVPHLLKLNKKIIK